MQAISFKNTALFKRGIWLSAAALAVFIGGPAALSGELWRHALPSAIPLGVLAAALVYFFWSTQMHRLADQVLDCGDRLKIRRGSLEEIIPLSQISAAQVVSGCGFQRITLLLRSASHFGRRIDFLPQASLWSNPAAIRRVALDLTERANSSAPKLP